MKQTKKYDFTKKQFLFCLQKKAQAQEEKGVIYICKS